MLLYVRPRSQQWTVCIVVTGLFFYRQDALPVAQSTVSKHSSVSNNNNTNNNNKLAPYRTAVNSYVLVLQHCMWAWVRDKWTSKSQDAEDAKLRLNIKNLPKQSYILSSSLRFSSYLLAPFLNDEGDRVWKCTSFQDLVTLNDLGSGHMAYCRASIIDLYILYMPNFIQIGRTFLTMDRRTVDIQYVRTNIEISFTRLTRRKTLIDDKIADVLWWRNTYQQSTRDSKCTWKLGTDCSLGFICLITLSFVTVKRLTRVTDLGTHYMLISKVILCQKKMAFQIMSSVKVFCPLYATWIEKLENVRRWKPLIWSNFHTHRYEVNVNGITALLYTENTSIYDVKMW